MRVQSIQERIETRLNVHIKHHKKGINSETYNSYMYNYHKHKLDQALAIHDIIEDEFQEYQNDHEFFRGSLKVAVILAGLFAVGYLLSWLIGG